MSIPELFNRLQTNQKNAPREAFEMYYCRLAGVATRYAKNHEQAEELFNFAFNVVLSKIRALRQPPLDLDEFVEKEFIIAGIAFIKNIRSEYYVSSTVYAPGETRSRNYDLFDTPEVIDYRQIDNEILLRGIHQLVPSQRLIFNLHVIEGYSLPEAAAILECSEGTVRSNLEKARFNLQKNIDKCLKTEKV